MLSGRSLCDGQVTRPDESYRVGVFERDPDSSQRSPRSTVAVQPLDQTSYMAAVYKEADEYWHINNVIISIPDGFNVLVTR